MDTIIKPNSRVVLGEFIRETFLAKNPQFTEDDLLKRVYDVLHDLWGTDVDPSAARALRRMAAEQRIRQGYREGVYLISLKNTQGFKRRIRELVPGDYLFGKYTSRVEGEAPRKKTSVLHVGDLPDAGWVDAVLYANHVLAENPNETCKSWVDFEVVTFLAKDSPEDEPMDVETLLHNHYLSEGGTSTKMSDSEFVAKLRESFEYWKTRAHIH